MHNFIAYIILYSLLSITSIYFAIDGYHRRSLERERTVILMELVELRNIRTFYLSSMKNVHRRIRFSNMLMGHVRLLRRILYVPCIIHVLHVLHVPSMLPLEYRMRVSASNFSGPFSYLASIQPFSVVSLTLATPLCECFAQTHIMYIISKHAFQLVLHQTKTESYIPQFVNYTHVMHIN